MAGYAGVPNNLPDIDIDADDMYAPEAYRSWVQVRDDAGEPPAAPPMDARVPSYHEHAPVNHYDTYAEYNAYHASPHNDFDYYAEHEKLEQQDIANTPVRHRDFARPVARYATPELEGQAIRGEDTSFDGPADYASTADHHESRYTAPLRVRATGRSPSTTTTTPRRRFGLYRSTNSKQNGDSSKSLAKSVDDEKAGRDEDDVPLNPHFGPVPTVQLRRNRTKRRIGLTAGNLVIDAPIPSRLAGFLPRKGTEEFDKMR